MDRLTGSTGGNESGGNEQWGQHFGGKHGVDRIMDLEVGTVSSVDKKRGERHFKANTGRRQQRSVRDGRV